VRVPANCLAESILIEFQSRASPIAIILLARSESGGLKSLAGRRGE